MLRLFDAIRRIPKDIHAAQQQQRAETAAMMAKLHEPEIARQQRLADARSRLLTTRRLAFHELVPDANTIQVDVQSLLGNFPEENEPLAEVVRVTDPYSNSGVLIGFGERGLLDLIRTDKPGSTPVATWYRTAHRYELKAKSPVDDQPVVLKATRFYQTSILLHPNTRGVLFATTGNDHPYARGQSLSVKLGISQHGIELLHFDPETTPLHDAGTTYQRRLNIRLCQTDPSRFDLESLREE